MRARAVVVRAIGLPAAIEDLDLDDPREGEILVRLVAAGVSRHDLDALDGASPAPLPLVPGTEAAGIVEKVGAGVVDHVAGDAVLVAYAACRACPACDAGDLRRCRRFAALNLSGRRGDGTTPMGDPAIGGFFFGQSAWATHLLCRAGDAIPVAADAALEVLAVLAGEFLRGAGPVLRLEGLGRQDAAVIAGAGVTGLAACLTARALGVDTIILAEPDLARHRLAESAGASHVVPDVEGLAAVVAAVVPAERVRLVLDASGTPSAVRACLACHGADGHRFSVAAAVPDGVLSADAALDPHAMVPRLAALHADGVLPLERLVTFFLFDRVNDAVDAARSNAVTKAVLRFPLDAFGGLDRAVGGAAEADDGASSAGTDADAPAPDAVPVIA